MIYSLIFSYKKNIWKKKKHLLGIIHIDFFEFVTAKFKLNLTIVQLSTQFGSNENKN